VRDATFMGIWLTTLCQYPFFLYRFSFGRKIIMKTSKAIEGEKDMTYTGMFNIKKIEGIKIGTVYWIDRPDLW
jgi:hypothetical protein